MNSPAGSGEAQTPTPAGISERQNEQANLNLLAAQRQLYTEEKRRTYLWYAVATIIALLATGALSAFNQYAPLITLFAVLAAIGELFLLHNIRQRRVTAAGVQEQFDCNVLKLPWNYSLAKTPDSQEVTEAVARFRRRRNSDEAWKSLRNWYDNPPILTLPLHQARLECQQQNLGWDRRLRHTWSWFLLGSLILLSIVLAAIGVNAGWTLGQYLSGPMLLFIPIAFGALSAAVGQYRAIERLEYLAVVLEHLKEDAARAKTDSQKEDVRHRTRDLQTEIYHHRCDDSPVPDRVYERVRKKLEKLMARA